MVNRLLSRALLSDQPGPHMGLATAAYTNFTSPLRKALDFFVHLQIAGCLSGDTTARYPLEQLPKITRAMARSREAVAAADRRLVAKYLDKLKTSGQTRFSGTVSHISSSGFTVKLTDTGLEGLVDLRPDSEKFSFDKWTMSLTSTTRRFQLLQRVEVEFVGAPADQDFLAQFSLVDGCGLKPPKEPKPENNIPAAGEDTNAAPDGAASDA
jgi:ribonuclease R